MNPENNSPETPQRRNGKFAPGVSGNPRGRPRGTRNKVSESIRQEFIEAYEEVGGRKFLVRFAREHPRDFINILGKMLPKDIRHEINNAPLGDPEVLEEMKREWIARREPVKVIEVETKAE